MNVVNSIPPRQRRYKLTPYIAETIEFIESGAHLARMDRFANTYSVDIYAYECAVRIMLNDYAYLDNYIDVVVIPRNGHIYLKRV